MLRNFSGQSQEAVMSFSRLTVPELRFEPPCSVPVHGHAMAPHDENPSFCSYVFGAPPPPFSWAVRELVSVDLPPSFFPGVPWALASTAAVTRAVRFPRGACRDRKTSNAQRVTSTNDGFADRAPRLSRPFCRACLGCHCSKGAAVGQPGGSLVSSRIIVFRMV